MTYTPGFYVFEGLDGSGKSTLCRLLLDRLVSKGVPCISFAEPTKYESGIFLRRFLSGEIELSPEEQIRAFLDDRAVSLERNILPALREKKIVLLDRYMYSTAAYQAGKQFSASEILRRNLDRGFPEPISVFYLELSPETALSRLQSRNEKTERFETLSVLRKISEAYEEILPANTIRLDAKLAPERLVELAEERISY
ncbi:dTMP kinase [Leptospira wolffii]|uniref:Thymidylate kinase n=1 Tax=Leptospira wolffii TaxID=409998 RepID=A0A2M9ZA74_9LEPT|nr:dTMP kinase [Leptospira wolffii]PJZ65257.1 dTMP kinase [Leptospira wolffii]TGK64861.1 dTMP kinase [Leptospira wolffii]TGK76740.1 dTMP kinase [Leptospira wolffii]TGK77408.1 dTMP kinase [Leptospira wolffii]TGL26803.1 dTMP kinase [Leptospira wolffii]